ncbi:phage tail assembly chaperone [Roseibium alexandrii]|uniref:Uncharacterized protein n=1 Tax=Roseibium alexandrii TaxID=388408 RepID=A0A0M6ZXV4_9HYPH|nr:hypothetical protein [Roseibium alexandrii]CTQ67117.1 hypothetical protein LAX5112_01219 [Roseibium alexandrii]
MPEKKIAGAEYRVEPLAAKDAYLLLTEIIRLAGPGAKHLPGLMAILSTTDPKERFLADVAAFAACSEVINVHGASAFVDLKQRVISNAQVKRPSGIYDHLDLEDDFCGDLETAEKVFDFVMEVQFGNFSAGSEANGPVALAMIIVRNIFRIQKSAK